MRNTWAFSLFILSGFAWQERNRWETRTPGTKGQSSFINMPQNNQHFKMQCFYAVLFTMLLMLCMFSYVRVKMANRAGLAIQATREPRCVFRPQSWYSSPLHHSPLFYVLNPSFLLVFQGSRGQRGAKGEAGARGVAVSHLRFVVSFVRRNCPRWR